MVSKDGNGSVGEVAKCSVRRRLGDDGRPVTAMSPTMRRLSVLPFALLVGGAAFPQITQAIPAAKLAASDGASNDLYGNRVAISGQRALIGAYADTTPSGTSAGSAYVVERQADGSWLQVAKLTANDGASNDFFGFSVALDGDRALIGAMSKSAAGSAVGAAYVFERQPHGSWMQVAKLEEAGARRSTSSATRWRSAAIAR